MIRSRFLFLTAAVMAWAGNSWADEVNNWPARVERFDGANESTSWQVLGPIIFKKKSEDGSYWCGVRPFYIARHSPAGTITEWEVLYPIFSYRVYQDGYRVSILSVINRSITTGVSTPAGTEMGNDIWPFYFSRETGDPLTSYHATFPILGTIKNRFGSDRISWFLFPLYSRSDTHGTIVTESPWPIIKTIHGGGQRGFYFWPLYGWREKNSAYRNHFWLWPLGYKTESLDPEIPGEKFGFLPFYAREKAPGLKSETYFWPFFGYTDRTLPKEYHEKRYFWPMFVQGRGSDRFRNRWGPFYTHSVVKGYDKTWFAWPFFKRTQWEDDGIIQTKKQFYFFIWWSLEQQSAARPNLPHAYKKHGWPLFSAWDNGAGKRQVQVLSPFEVLMPSSEPVRVAWSPLVALYRFDQTAPDDRRHAFLFDFVTWHQQGATREVHVGPLFSQTTDDSGQRIAVAHGLFAAEKDSTRKGWSVRWFDFRSNPRVKPQGPPSSK